MYSHNDKRKQRVYPSFEYCKQIANPVIPLKDIKNGLVHLTDLDFDSIEDPGNPENWSVLMRVYIKFTTSWLCLIVSFCSSVYVTGLPQIREEFHVSQTLSLADLLL